MIFWGTNPIFELSKDNVDWETIIDTSTSYADVLRTAKRLIKAFDLPVDVYIVKETDDDKSMIILNVTHIDYHHRYRVYVNGYCVSTSATMWDCIEFVARWFRVSAQDVELQKVEV